MNKFHLCYLLTSILLFLLPSKSGAQTFRTKGTEAQSVEESIGQQDFSKVQIDKKERLNISVPFLSIQRVDSNPAEDAAVKLWRHSIAINSESQQPKRAIPIVFITLGIIFILLWMLFLLGAILAIDPVSKIIFLAFTIAFSPLFILGVIFLLGGIIASVAKSKS